ncbi:MAG: flagellar motor protein MotB [Nitrospira sp.]|nr:flagellar motor protein MotB [Nitrospira sp.]
MGPKQKEIIMRGLKTTVVMTGVVVLMGCASSLKQPDPYIKQSQVCTDRWYGYHQASGCPSVVKAAAPAASKEMAARQAALEMSSELAAANQRVADLESQLADRDKELSGLRGDLSAETAKLQEAQRGLFRALRPEITKGNIAVDLNSERLLINLASGYLFGSGEAQLKPAGVDALKQVGAILNEYPQYRVAVDGHTDNQPIGDALKKRYPTNKELSEARANNAAQALRDGGLASNLSATGHGESNPVASNNTAEGRAKNRRVEVIVK